MIKKLDPKIFLSAIDSFDHDGISFVEVEKILEKRRDDLKLFNNYNKRQRSYLPQNADSHIINFVQDDPSVNDNHFSGASVQYISKLGTNFSKERSNYKNQIVQRFGNSSNKIQPILINNYNKDQCLNCGIVNHRANNCLAYHCRWCNSFFASNNAAGDLNYHHNTKCPKRPTFGKRPINMVASIDSVQTTNDEEE